MLEFDCRVAEREYSGKSWRSAAGNAVHVRGLLVSTRATSIWKGSWMMWSTGSCIIRTNNSWWGSRESRDPCVYLSGAGINKKILTDPSFFSPVLSTFIPGSYASHRYLTLRLRHPPHPLLRPQSILFPIHLVPVHPPPTSFPDERYD